MPCKQSSSSLERSVVRNWHLLTNAGRNLPVIWEIPFGIRSSSPCQAFEWLQPQLTSDWNWWEPSSQNHTTKFLPNFWPTGNVRDNVCLLSYYATKFWNNNRNYFYCCYTTIENECSIHVNIVVVYYAYKEKME